MGRSLQVNHNFPIHMAFVVGVAVPDDVFPHTSVTALGHQLLPPRAPEGVLALLGPELDDRIEKGEVEAPDFDARAARCGSHWGDCGPFALLGAIGVVRAGRRDDGFNGREGFRQAARQEELGSLAVGFGHVRRVVAAGGEGGDGRRKHARVTHGVVVRSHGVGL